MHLQAENSTGVSKNIYIDEHNSYIYICIVRIYVENQFKLAVGFCRLNSAWQW